MNRNTYVVLLLIIKDELAQVAVLHTKHVIIGSDVCRSTIKDYSNNFSNNTTLKTLIDIISLDQIPKVENICTS